MSIKKCVGFLLSLFTLWGISGFEAHGETISLNGTWKLFYWPQPDPAVVDPADFERVQDCMEQVPAQVPGNVELDLFAAGVIPDPMIGSNVNGLRRFEGYQWCYSRTFPSPKLEAGQRAELFFGGIDCIAEIWVNGKHVGSSANMLIERRFDVTDLLNETEENTLQIILRSAVLEGQNHLLGTFSIGNFPSEESIFVRKAPHMYGWDIMPRLVSAGLWRSVELRTVNPARIVDVHWMTAEVDTDHNRARVFVDFQTRLPFEKLDKAKIVFTMSRDGKEVYRGEQLLSAHAGRHIIALDSVALWWPRGYGDPALYEATAQLLDADGSLLDTDTKRIGIRTVKLELSDIHLEKEPGKFCFIINGERIFVRGTNWVPLDALHSRDASLVDDAMRLVVDANCNMVRCWGGNVYEDHHFFDLCDENGIMVWQDFTMGCTFYPQREEFTRAIEEEVTSVVVKLRSHPSLVLWAGNNEDDAALRWTLVPFNINPNRDVVTRQVIPSVLYEFDPTRPYLPSSPYYSQAVWEHGSADQYLPENHLWGPRGYYKDPFYTAATCTFVSEIGYHGCPNRSSLERMMTPDAVYPWSEGRQWNDEWLTKSTRRFEVWGQTNDRNNLMLNQVTLLFGSVPEELDDFIFASQVVQAEAMKFFIEMWRGNKFDGKTGIIWWNVRDGWPIISDAVADYYNSPKLAYRFISNVQSNVCVLINDPVEGKYPLRAVNDTRRPVSGHVVVTDVATGRQLYEGDYSVGANGKSEVAQLPVMEGQGILQISYETEEGVRQNHYLYGKAPFDLGEYRKLLSKTGIYPVKK